jgi:quercetin dioxygenase-like cupin family protein
MPPRLERITRGSAAATLELAAGASILEFASARLEALGFTTGLVRFAPGARLPCHSYNCGQSATVLAGRCQVEVQGRSYELHTFDSIHIPAGIDRTVQNLDTSSNLLVHTAFSSANAEPSWAEVNRDGAHDTDLRPAGEPECLRRFASAEEYELSSNAWFKDLFAKRLGAQGICGGYGRFAPGASLPCHTHLYDESITIVEGAATCLVAGRRHALSDYDTALVPQTLPHRFINESSRHMAMVWVYAGDEPERVIVENSRCSEGIQTL